VGRLLAEGNEGRFVLIKGQSIIGIYESWNDARAVALSRFLNEASLTQQIRTWEPLYRVRRYY
jgi:hypothetical protein